MKSSILFTAASLLTAASALSPTRILAMRATPAGKGKEKPSEQAMLGVIKTQGCFSSPGDLVLNTTLIFNAIGSCGTDICEKILGKPVAATSGGNQCWCGDSYPPANTRVDDENCNVGCTGYNIDACGGIKFYTVYNTGITLDVDFAGGNDAKASGTGTAGTKPTQTPVDPPKTTIIVNNNTPVEEKKSTNTAGIAAGVVVGVVLLSAACGALFFYQRRKKNREIEEEHRRNAAVNSFMGKPPSSSGMSISDSRLDPVMAQRRMSDGSIADNQDYSRRILRVTNA